MSCLLADIYKGSGGTSCLHIPVKCRFQFLSKWSEIQ